MSNFPFQRLQADLAALISKTGAGDRLPSEPDLAKQMGVSQSTFQRILASACSKMSDAIVNGKVINIQKSNRDGSK